MWLTVDRASGAIFVDNFFSGIVPIGSLYCAGRLPTKDGVVCMLCHNNVQFHCACLRSEKFFPNLPFSTTLITNPKSSQVLHPQFSNNLIF